MPSCNLVGFIDYDTLPREKRDFMKEYLNELITHYPVYYHFTCGDLTTAAQLANDLRSRSPLDECRSPLNKRRSPPND